MIRGEQLWWKRGRAALPAVFECWRRQKLAAVVLTPYDGRSHEALVPLLSPAVDADAWAAHVAGLQAAALALGERQRLLDSNVAVGALVRELELVPGSKRIRERTIEAVLAAARRLEAAMLIPWAEALADWLIDLPYRRKSRKARREVEAILAETPKQTYERLMREGIDG